MLDEPKRSERNAAIIAFIKIHGDTVTVYRELAAQHAISLAHVRAIWQAYFQRWNYQRHLKGLSVILCPDRSTARARFLIAPASDFHRRLFQPTEDLLRLPRLTVEAAFRILE